MFEDLPILVDHDECYYCEKPVTWDYGWNAVRDEIHHRWKCHGKCMDKERSKIKRTRDWDRGQKFSNLHGLDNPLGSKSVYLRCGCKVFVTRFKLNGQWFVSCMDSYCWYHWAAIKMRFLYYMKRDHPKASALHNKRFSEICKELKLKTVEDYYENLYSFHHKIMCRNKELS